jgi:uridine monophosphate synthetase
MEKQKILESLTNANVVRFGEFTLVSGESSPIYVDLRVLPSYPAAFEIVTDALTEIVRKINPDIIAGTESAGIPLSTAVAMKLKKPMVYVRKKPKDYGTEAKIEGIVRENEKVVLIDDLITDGGSKLNFINPIKNTGATIKDVVVILDREQGGEDTMMKNGLELHKLITLRELLSYMVDNKFINKEQYSKALVYLQG